MMPEPPGVSAGRLAGSHTPAGASGYPASARLAARAGEIERAYPEFHVWVSDDGWWYATRRHPWACGQAATVHGPGPGELVGALAEEEAAAVGRAMAGAW
jgi:hypothetical protein